jgi:carbonic anhydrase
MQRNGFPSVAIICAVAATLTTACGTSEGYRDEKTEWGYTGEIGPDNWGSLAKGFELCDQGLRQSPIDVAGASGAYSPPVIARYGESTLVVMNKGGSAKVVANGYLSVDGKRFELLQLHFHGPSEHAADGTLYDMEVHFVHRSDDGQFAVLGAFMRKGADNSTLAHILEHVPTVAGEKATVPDVTIDPSDLLPSSGAGHTFAGSLTTPPCSEGLTWYVLSEPVEVSEAQIAAFRSLFGANARPVQPTNDRTIQSIRFIKDSGKSS